MSSYDLRLSSDTALYFRKRPVFSLPCQRFPPRLQGWIRRPTLGELRSATGLIIGLYVTMHLSNHALGLISVRGQEAVRPWVMALWHSPPGQLLLYGSLVTHATIALYVLMRRRHYYMPAWEGVQILLGLTIPYLLLGPHCKHARHPRSDWNRHRLHLRDR